MKTITYLVLLIFGQVMWATQNSNSKLIEEAVFVASKYYKHQFVTNVVFNCNASGKVNYFLKTFPGSVEVTNMCNGFDTSVIYNEIRHVAYMQTVFFTYELDAFTKFMHNINHYLRYAIRLVLVLEKPTNDHTELLSYNKVAWLNNLVDIVIVSYNDGEEITLSSYFPYNGGICGNNFPVTLKHDDNMFPNKCSNFNKCPFRVTVARFLPFVEVVRKNGTLVEIGGYDGTALMLIKNTINATLEYKEASSEHGFGAYFNGILTGTIRDLVYNKTDMSIPAAILNLERFSVAQISHVYYEMDIRWIGPKRREIYYWIKVLVPFLTSVTPLLLLAVILFIIVAILINRFNPGHKVHTRGISFQTFTLLLGQPANYITKVPLLNILFLIWMWFCFIIRIHYQGDLVQSLQNQILEPPFGSLEEAVKRVDGYGGTKPFLNFYRDTPLEHGYKVITLSDFNDYLKRISQGERFLLAVDSFLVQRVRGFIQILDVKISTSWSCFYMRPGWPAAQTIDLIIMRLEESGFFKKIAMDNDEYKPDSRKKIGSKSRPLDIIMFSAYFYALSLMRVVCSAVYFFEIVHHKYQSRQNK